MKNTLFIIVTYNHENEIQKCVDSLIKRGIFLKDVVIIDNHSRDKTVEILESKYSGVNVILNNQNLGFAKAVNLGINFGMNKDYEYFFLLNPDTQILKMEDISDLFTQNIGIVQSLILMMNDLSKINTFGNSINYLGFSFCEGLYESIQNINTESWSIISASGASMIIKKEVIQKIGGLDEFMFLYFEDADFSWRSRIAGFQILGTSKISVAHDYIYKENPKRFYFLEKYRLWSVLKNYQLSTLILLLPVILFIEFGMIVKAFLGGWGVLKLKSYFEIFANFRLLLSERKKIKNIRKVSDGEIINIFKPSIETLLIKDPILRYLINPLIKTYYKIVQNLIF